MICLPYNIGIIHLLPVRTKPISTTIIKDSVYTNTNLKNNLYESALDPDAPDRISVTDINDFDHTIESEANTKE